MMSLLLKDVPMGIVSTFRKMEEEAVDGGLPPGAYSIEDLVEMFKPMARLLLNALIVSKVAASISLLSSSALIWMIRRSYVGLSKTQNRILVALSMADISNAMGHLCANLSTPSGMSYMLLGSHGNDTSCIINGFFTTLGFIAAPLYTCSLNLYFLAVVKYAKSEEYIRKKLEPLLHAFPILTALGISIALLANGNYNTDNMGNCTGPVNDPPHCIGYEDGVIREGFEVPCGRGRNGGILFFTVYLWLLMGLSIVVILGSLALIYSTVSKLEKKTGTRYGAGAFKSKLALRTATDNSSEDPTSKSGVWSKIKNTLTRNKPKDSSPELKKSRTVMHKAFAYSFAWFLTNTFLVVNMVILYLVKAPLPMPLLYLNGFCTPLQGFYVFVIYLFPQVTALKRKSKKNPLTWRQALVQAFWSKGAKPRNYGGRNVPVGNRLRQDENKKGKIGTLFKKKEKKNGAIQEEKKKPQAPPTPSGTSSSTRTNTTGNSLSTRPLTSQTSSKFAANESGSTFTSNRLHTSSSHHSASGFHSDAQEDVQEDESATNEDKVEHKTLERAVINKVQFEIIQSSQS